MANLPEDTLHMALRFLSAVPFDEVPRQLPDDDGETISAVMVYADLERQGMVAREVCAETIRYSITDAGRSALPTPPEGE